MVYCGAHLIDITGESKCICFSGGNDGKIRGGSNIVSNRNSEGLNSIIFKRSFLPADYTGTVQYKCGTISSYRKIAEYKSS